MCGSAGGYSRRTGDGPSAGSLRRYSTDAGAVAKSSVAPGGVQRRNDCTDSCGNVVDIRVYRSHTGNRYAFRRAHRHYPGLIHVLPWKFDFGLADRFPVEEHFNAGYLVASFRLFRAVVRDRGAPVTWRERSHIGALRPDHGCDHRSYFPGLLLLAKIRP